MMAAEKIVADSKDELKKPLTTLDVYEVHVERSNNEVISSEAFKYEIPVLQALHTKDRVKVGDVLYSADTDLTAEDALLVLQNKYNGPQAGDVVFRAYRDADDLSSKSGLPRRKIGAEGPPKSAQSDGRKRK